MSHFYSHQKKLTLSLTFSCLCYCSLLMVVRCLVGPPDTCLGVLNAIRRLRNKWHDLRGLWGEVYWRKNRRVRGMERGQKIYRMGPSGEKEEGSELEEQWVWWWEHVLSGQTTHLLALWPSGCSKASLCLSFIICAARPTCRDDIELGH